jgi:hypothetical protein
VYGYHDAKHNIRYKNNDVVDNSELHSSMHMHNDIPSQSELSNSRPLAASQYGAVVFKTSCNPSVADDFNTAVSMFYSFWYSQSLSTFQNIYASDSSCCMALWGAAYTYSHPIWDFISPSRLASAANYSQQATACATKYSTTLTPLEKAYIEALAVYYNESDHSNPATVLRNYANALKEKVVIPYSTIDDNVGVLYGLALLAVGFYDDYEPQNGFPNLKQAGIIEEEMVFRNPLSPGGLHYVIHAYDQPGMAPRALDAAYTYLNASVAVPHAIHMPSHIFGDLGLWTDSVSANVLSMNTATGIAGHFTGDWYHGAYFLQYGMLQMAMDCDAKNLLNGFQQMSLSADSSTFFSNKESILRIPIHYFIETRDWNSAAKFTLSTFYPTAAATVWDSDIWTRIYADFMVTVAKAILNYPKSEIIAARQAVDTDNSTLFSDPDWKKYQLPYWRLSFNVMVKSARAWEQFRTVSFDAGIAFMEEVLQLQVDSWQPEVAHSWDAHEQLGEMLLIRRGAGDVERALEVYEAALDAFPNRYHTLAGAANCAQILKNRVKASKYYGALLSLTSGPFPSVSIQGLSLPACPTYEPSRRPEIAAATAYFGDSETHSTSNNNTGTKDNVTYFTLTWSLILALILGALVGWFSKVTPIHIIILLCSTV